MIWPRTLRHLRQDIKQVLDAQIIMLCLLSAFLPLIPFEILYGVILSWIVTRLSSDYSLKYTGAKRARELLKRMTRAQLGRWLALSAAIVVGIRLQVNAAALIIGYALGQICYFSAAIRLKEARTE